MMSDKMTEGPAERTLEPSMSLRDYFAAHAHIGSEFSAEVASMLNGPAPHYINNSLQYLQWYSGAVAKWRFMQADAMIAESAK